MSRITGGGHALMLGVALESDVETAVRRFASGHPERVIKEPLHLTLAFVGRDQPRSVGSRMRGVVAGLESRVPGTISLGSRMELFGRDGRHLVMLARESDALRELREAAVYTLSSFGLPCESRWRPHVTLCVLESARIQRERASERADLLEAVSDARLSVTSLVAKIGSEMFVPTQLSIGGAA